MSAAPPTRSGHFLAAAFKAASRAKRCCSSKFQRLPVARRWNRMGSLFDPGQKHAGLAFCIDDFHCAPGPRTFACRVSPSDLVFFAAVTALDHVAFGAQLRRLLFVFDVDECDRVRGLANQHQLGSGIEFFNLCLLVNAFERLACFECRLRFRAGNHERERRAHKEEVFEMFHIFGFRVRLEQGRIWL